MKLLRLLLLLYSLCCNVTAVVGLFKLLLLLLLLCCFVAVVVAGVKSKGIDPHSVSVSHALDL